MQQACRLMTTESTTQSDRVGTNCDLGVAVKAVTVGDDVRVCAGRGEVEGERLVRKGGEDVAGCLMQFVPAPSFGQACDAVAYLGYRDRRGVDVVAGCSWSQPSTAGRGLDT